MKLVENSSHGGVPGELPAAETCALSDEDEEEDAVAFKSKGDKMFGKLNNSKVSV